MVKRTHRDEKVTRRTARHRIELSYCSIIRGSYALQSHVIVVCMYGIRPRESVVLEQEVPPHDTRYGQRLLLEPRQAAAIAHLHHVHIPICSN